MVVNSVKERKKGTGVRHPPDLQRRTNPILLETRSCTLFIDPVNILKICCGGLWIVLCV